MIKQKTKYSFVSDGRLYLIIEPNDKLEIQLSPDGSIVTRSGNTYGSIEEAYYSENKKEKKK